MIDYNFSPMLIGSEGDAFDDEDYIYEFKFDGIRALAYLKAKEGTKLINKRSLIVSATYPELLFLHKQVKDSCVLDGEIVVLKDGKPDFSAVQKRSLMSNKTRIAFAMKTSPVTFVAFDILFLKDEDLTKLPLIKRKELLFKTVKPNERILLSEHIEKEGIYLSHLSKKNSLEGIVAKRKRSLYYPGERTKDWIKIKNLCDDDFIICGYIKKDHGVVSLVLGQYVGKKLTYMGHVTMGLSNRDFALIEKAVSAKAPPFESVPEGNDSAVWIKPSLVGKVSFMERSINGRLRQPVFKGLRNDKKASECVYEK